MNGKGIITIDDVNSPANLVALAILEKDFALEVTADGALKGKTVTTKPEYTPEQAQELAIAVVHALLSQREALGTAVASASQKKRITEVMDEEVAYLSVALLKPEECQNDTTFLRETILRILGLRDIPAFDNNNDLKKAHIKAFHAIAETGDNVAHQEVYEYIQSYKNALIRSKERFFTQENPLKFPEQDNHLDGHEINENFNAVLSSLGEFLMRQDSLRGRYTNSASLA